MRTKNETSSYKSRSPEYPFAIELVTAGLSIDEINIIILLSAGDMVLIGNSPEDLQNSLNRLHLYCSEWGLTVNTSKTKVVLFRKKGKCKAR